MLCSHWRLLKNNSLWCIRSKLMCIMLKNVAQICMMVLNKSRAVVLIGRLYLENKRKEWAFLFVFFLAGERPFQCRYCPYSASQKGNLKTHVLCVHRVPFDNTQYPDRRFQQPQNDDPNSPIEEQLENFPISHQISGVTVLEWKQCSARMEMPLHC